MYAGVEFGAECYCGHRVQSTNTSDSECQMDCTGDQSKLCGGANRLSIYRLKLSQESARRRECNSNNTASPQGAPQEAATHTGGGVLSLDNNL